jgi:hypothetical protein
VLRECRRARPPHEIALAVSDELASVGKTHNFAGTPASGAPAKFRILLIDGRSSGVASEILRGALAVELQEIVPLEAEFSDRWHGV